jgi:hypothetical protein
LAEIKISNQNRKYYYKIDRKNKEKRQDRKWGNVMCICREDFYFVDRFHGSALDGYGWTDRREKQSSGPVNKIRNLSILVHMFCVTNL